MIEKRLFSRLKADFTVKFHLNDETVDYKGIIINLSEDGFSFILNQLINFKKEEIIKLELNFKGTIIKVSGELKWAQESKEQYHYGVRIAANDNSQYRIKVRNLYESQEVGYFIFDTVVYLKDVNIYGTAYFSRYFDWQGMAREQYFMTVKDYQSIMTSGIKLITRRAWVDYENHCGVFDNLIIKIQNKNIKKVSFEMLFTYFNKHTGKLIATGGQVLVFSDSADKLTPIPGLILDVILKHQAL